VTAGSRNRRAEAVKFTDGYWMLREGVRAWYPVSAHEVVRENGELTILAPTHPVHSRGDTLKGPVVTVRLSAPAPDVIRVSICHHAGGSRRSPAFDVNVVNVSALEGSTSNRVADQAQQVAELASAGLVARVHMGEAWRVDFEGSGRILTSSGTKGLALLRDSDGTEYIRDQLDLHVGTHVYGLGERFGPLVKNGQTVDIWNADAGTSSEQAYKNVPFLMTDAGYGIFVDHPGHVSFEVGSESVSRVSFSVSGQELEYLVIHGSDAKEILSRYTALTGRPALPPAWSFGTWLSTSFTTDYDETTITSFVEGMQQRDLPLSVFHFDCFWMREFHWCDFEWDATKFSDPVGMLARLNARGLRICVWINPYIAQASTLFDEGRRLGYLVLRRDGAVWQSDQWQPGMALVDFTNPDAGRWYAAKLQQLLGMGVDCFKTDFGERIPLDVVWFDGSDPERMHNYYTHLYNKCVFDLLVRERGEGEAVVFARSATAGGQQYPVHWGGDCESTFAAMAETLRGGLSLAASGFGFWSHDIGGFEGQPDPELYKRWTAFGMLSTHSRFHGSSSYRVPWLIDDEAVEVVRRFSNLKMQLMPYLFQAAVQAHTTGIPVMRPMALEFSEDPACTYLDRQYMLGDSLLVAPVMSADGSVTFYVPHGVWTNILDDTVVEGPAWVTQQHSFLSMPLLARPGSVIPVGARGDRPDYDWADSVRLHVYGVADGATVITSIPASSGEASTVFETTRRGNRITVERVMGDSPFEVHIADSGSGADRGARSVRVKDATGIRAAGPVVETELTRSHVEPSEPSV
jgi:alpha-D-xyloside xylohydrolase